MKIHRYQVTVYEGALDWIHGGGQTQDRLYVPGQGVIGYRRDYKNEKNIDAFCGEPEDIAEAEKCIRGESKIGGGVKYLGEIDLPDEEVLKVVSCGRALNQAREKFQKNAESLVDKIK